MDFQEYWGRIFQRSDKFNTAAIVFHQTGAGPQDQGMPNLNATVQRHVDSIQASNAPSTWKQKKKCPTPLV